MPTIKTEHSVFKSLKCITIRKFTGIKELDLFLRLILDTFEHIHGEPIRERGRVWTDREKCTKEKVLGVTQEKLIKDFLKHFKISPLDFVRRHHIII